MKSETYQYLNQYKYLLVDIKALKEKIENLSNDVYVVCSTSIIEFEKDRNIKDCNPDTLLGSKISSLLDLRQEYEKKVYSAEVTCNEIRLFIQNNCDDLLSKTILERYFCDGWNMEKIAVNTNYSFQYIRRKFYKILKALDDTYKIRNIMVVSGCKRM